MNEKSEALMKSPQKSDKSEPFKKKDNKSNNLLESLGHNIFSYVFGFLSLSELTELRLTCISLNNFVLQYLRNNWYPKNFTSFILSDEISEVNQLQKRISSLKNVVQRLFQEDHVHMILKALASPHKQIAQQIITCYDVVFPGFASTVKSIDFSETLPTFFESELKFPKDYGINIDFEALKEAVSGVVMPQFISIEIREIASVIRLFSQLLFFNKLQSKVQKIKGKIASYRVITKVLHLENDSEISLEQKETQ